MKLGEKLRQARLEAGLSQRQLCGEEITRNMLSQIENGVASPSMATLRYFADRLGKPIAWFLEEERETSSNLEIIVAAREAFRRGDPEVCREHLAKFREPDTLLEPEYRLLMTQTLLNLAEQAAQAGKKPYAMELLSQAEAFSAQCLYGSAQFARQQRLLLFQLKPEQAQDLVQGLPNLDEELFLRACAARASGDLLRSEALLNSMEQRTTPQWAVAMAEVLFAREEYPQAAKYYTLAEEAMPEQTLSRLEQCFNAMEDYKLAYFYACKQREQGNR